MTERQIHDGFNVWLRERSIPFIESRMDRKSTIAKAWPDYSIFWMDRALMIEVKTAKGRLRPDQVTMIEFIRRSGNRVEIVRSVPECIEACQTILCERALNVGQPANAEYPLKREFAVLKEAVDAIGKDDEHIPVNGNGDQPKFQIGDWSGTPIVVRINGKGEPEFERIASELDRQRFPHRSARH